MVVSRCDWGRKSTEFNEENEAYWYKWWSAHILGWTKQLGSNDVIFGKNLSGFTTELNN